MTNAEKFKNVFGLYATELWSMPEKEFLEWLNAEIQPERKKGRWIEAVIPNDKSGLPVIICDQCVTFFPMQFGSSHNFCPECGADMRGENDGQIN